jgi:hypothetical protein
MQERFTLLRKEYPVFRYVSYGIERGTEEIVLSWRFSIPGLADFCPQTRIRTDKLSLVNEPASPLARRIVFALGLAEAVSYWKCVCPPMMEILCGELDAWESEYWKRLWFRGLGEFFFRNGVEVDFDSFVSLNSCGEPIPVPQEVPRSDGLCIIPVGGGKDSCVSLRLLDGGKNRLFTINRQEARVACALAAGYKEADIVACTRTIDPELLRLNAQGFLNGHTPFSAVTAYLSLYCGLLLGAREIALSNESSANESSVAGTDINHQYSKSFAFEEGFRAYCKRNLPGAPSYYSLLRPFNELQIAAQFSALRQFHGVFRSCNAGSKTNSWCCKCGKCLFTFGLLSAFLPPEELSKIFGKNLFEDEALLPEFEGLLGLSPVKPFECVGTTGEFRAALSMAVERYPAEKLPPLLKVFLERCGKSDPTAYLLERNGQHFVPPNHIKAVEEMYEYAASFVK